MRRIRVFLASPGDVAAERSLVYEVADRLRYEPGVAGLATIDVIAWDDPAGGVALLANETPQTTIDRLRDSPGECDFVVVILWGRLGTPPTGSHPGAHADPPVRSGTEWEFRVAAEAAAATGSPKILLYRRTEAIGIGPAASRAERDEISHQINLVADFFDDYGTTSTGDQIGVNHYARPENFERTLHAHLRALVHDLLEHQPFSPEAESPPPALWEGSPFPGLRSFTPADRPIFFGRSRETSLLVDRLRTNPFLAVVGASGSGKSSLVGAGLLPRLADGALGVSSHVPTFDRDRGLWNGLRITPAEVAADPFTSLGVALAPFVRRSPRVVAEELASDPSALRDAVEEMRQAVGTDSVTVFVDQFEELFTLARPNLVDLYVDSLVQLIDGGHAFVVLTMRSDFYHLCLERPALARLLEDGQFPLPAPTDMMYEIVARPAERAGLAFDDGLVDRILRDTGHDPSALPLLAFALDELYRRSSDRRLTFAAYEALGGVAGAIAMRANTIFDRSLADLTDIDVAHVFKSLLEVDEAGRVVRRRASLDDVAHDDKSTRFVSAFVQARLLVLSQADADSEPTVYVAHEALFHTWTRLAQWIETASEDLTLLRKLDTAVADWLAHERGEPYLWRHERLEPIYAMRARLEPDLSPETLEFIRPEYERVGRSFGDPATELYQRQADGDRLVAIGSASIGVVLPQLASDDRSIRDAASDVLARVGGPAVEPLIAGITEQSADERLGRLTALIRIRDPRTTPLLIELASGDDDPRIRATAVGAIESIDTDDARAAFEQLVTSTSTPIDVRWRAAGALGAFGNEAIPALVRSLADDSDRVGRQASAALLALGPSAATSLVGHLDGDDRQLALRVAEVLIELGADIGPVVEDALAYLGAEGREMACYVLATTGGCSGDAVAEFVRDVDIIDSLRCAAIAAAVRVATPECIDSVIGILTDEALDRGDSVVVRTAMTEALRGDDELVRRLGELAERDLGVAAHTRITAVLAGLGPRGQAELVRAADAAGRSGAGNLVAAAQVGNTDVGSTIAEARDHFDAPTLECAVGVLRLVGDRALEPIVTLVSSEHPAHRCAAATALGDAASTRSLRALLDLLGDPDATVRAAAARGLARSDERVLPALIDLALDPTDPRRDGAVEAILTIGEPATMPLIERASTIDDSDLAVSILTELGTARSLVGVAALGGGDAVTSRHTRHGTVGSSR